MPDCNRLDIRRRELPHQILIRLWRPPETAIDELARSLGLTWPRHPMCFTDDGSSRVYALAPGDWLTEGGVPLRAIEQRLAALSAVWSAVDFEPGRRCLSVSGEAAADLINCGCSLDLHARSFATGGCALTLFAGVRVLIAHVQPTAFEIQFDCAADEHVSSWVADAALSFSAASVRDTVEREAEDADLTMRSRHG